MSPAERRQELLEVLCRRRHDTYDNLARDFNVSKMTIRRDVAALMCSYPIETVHGGRHGCVRVMDGFYLNHHNKVRCGICGHAMKREPRKSPYYFCRTSKMTNAFLCTTERIPELDIIANKRLSAK